jgi:hypothetical protein
MRMVVRMTDRIAPIKFISPDRDHSPTLLLVHGEGDKDVPDPARGGCYILRGQVVRLDIGAPGESDVADEREVEIWTTQGRLVAVWATPTEIKALATWMAGGTLPIKEFGALRGTL